MPNHFHVEVAGVIRRLELRGVLTSPKAAEALDELIRWPLHAAAVTPLLRTAWTYRNNLTVSDALYIALAERLGASLLTDDRRLANAPTFPASVPKLMLP